MVSMRFRFFFVPHCSTLLTRVLPSCCVSRALQPPHWKQVWHCGVRNSKNGKLLAFISGIPANMRMHDQCVLGACFPCVFSALPPAHPPSFPSHSTQMLVEINFLCIHKKLRSKRLAPVLIREITRRVNCEGTFQAVYTAGVVLPRPISECRYWHRNMNPKKLVDIRFSHLPRGSTMAKLIKKYKLPTVGGWGVLWGLRRRLHSCWVVVCGAERCRC